MANINSLNNRSYFLTSDTGLTATTGNITATLGNVVITNGALTLGVSNGTDGQIPIATTAGNPVWASLTAGANVTITPAAGAITIAAAGAAAFAWAPAAADAALVANNGYINDKAALLTMTLPATAAVGTVIKLIGSDVGAGGWKIAQNALQYIWLGNDQTTVGVGGSLASTDIHDAISFVCVVADTGWVVDSVIGNITVV